MCAYLMPIELGVWSFIPTKAVMIDSNSMVASWQSSGLIAVEQSDGTYKPADETGVVNDGVATLDVASLSPRGLLLEPMTYQQLHQSMNATGSPPSSTQTPMPSTQATSPATPPAPPTPTTPAVTQPSTTAQPLTTFTGSIFNIGYPTNWIIDTNELKKPGYVDTTIRNPSDPEHTYLRIDYSLNVHASLYDAANGQRQSQPPGYRELGFDNTTLNGQPAIRWEFEGYQKGSDGQNVFVHKIDIFMIDSSHTGWAILTQAPATKYYSWLETFNAIFQSFKTTH
jgi:hypothetical protein